MKEGVNRQILLMEKPSGKLGPDHFRLVEGAHAEAERRRGPLARALHIAGRRQPRLDAWSDLSTGAGDQRRHGRRKRRRGDQVEGARVCSSDLVFSDTGWQDYAVLPAKHLAKVPHVEPMTHLFSVYEIAGLTAYFGLLDIGRPQVGETVVVSAAAGSVGSIVGQIAKVKGCRVVEIAGGAEKCRWLTAHLGFDAAVDYKGGDIFKALRAAAPKGIDVYFDNVGGDIFEACLAQMNFARTDRVLWRDLAI